jgi:uncharacterized protein YbaR (Trm112 family)
MDEEMLNQLVCSLGKAELRKAGSSLICTRCGPRFEIKDGIPNMLIEEADLPEECTSLADLDCVRKGDARLD